MIWYIIVFVAAFYFGFFLCAALTLNRDKNEKES